MHRGSVRASHPAAQGSNLNWHSQFNLQLTYLVLLLKTYISIVGGTRIKKRRNSKVSYKIFQEVFYNRDPGQLRDSNPVTPKSN